MENERSELEQLDLKTLRKLYFRSLFLTQLGWLGIVAAVISLIFLGAFLISPILLLFAFVHIRLRSRAARIFVLTESIFGLIAGGILALLCLHYNLYYRDPFALGNALAFLALLVQLPLLLLWTYLLVAARTKPLWGEARFTHPQLKSAYVCKKRNQPVSCDPSAPPQESSIGNVGLGLAFVALAVAMIAIGYLEYGLVKAEVEDQIQVLQELRRAQKGDVEAQYNLAVRYRKQYGVRQNIDREVYYLRKAAAQGHVKAQYTLGELYYRGEYVEKDPEQAVKWLLLAAGQGHVKAQILMAEAYDQGFGVKKDPEQAVYWLTKAAEQGDGKSQFKLGKCYLEGKGVEEDPERAAYWLTKAAEQGNEDAIKLMNKSEESEAPGEKR